MSANRLVKAFEEGDVDICVSPELHTATCIAHQVPLWSERYLLVTPKAALKDTSSAIDYMQTKPYIHLQIKDYDRRQSDRIVRTLGITPSKDITVGSSPAMLGCIAQGIGWALMPPVSIASGFNFFPYLDITNLPGVIAERTQYVSARHENGKKEAERLKELLLKLFKEHLQKKLNRKLNDAVKFFE